MGVGSSGLDISMFRRENCSTERVLKAAELDESLEDSVTRKERAEKTACNC